MAAVYGNAIKFVKASSQYASRTRVSTATNNITVAFWLYIDALPASGSATVFRNGDNANHTGYQLYLNTTGVLTCDMTFVANCNAGSALSTGTWIHVVLTRNAGTTSFYINGSSSGTTTGSAWNSLAADSVTGIGADFNNSTTAYGNYADVTMDDVRYYDRALSAGEITSLYNYGLNVNNGDISNTSLVAWWKMDETSGNPADSSGNSRTLTNANSSTFVTGKVMTSNSPASRTLLGVGA